MLEMAVKRFSKKLTKAIVVVVQILLILIYYVIGNSP